MLLRAPLLALAILALHAADASAQTASTIRPEDCDRLTRNMTEFPVQAIFRAVYSRATAEGYVDLESPDRDNGRIMAVDCLGRSNLSARMYESRDGEVRETQMLPLDAFILANSVDALPGRENKQLIDSFIQQFNTRLNNGAQFRLAFALDVNEARANLPGPGSVYFIGLIEPDRNGVTFARVILSDEGAVTSVTLSGLGTSYLFCLAAPPGMPRSTPYDDLTCEGGRLVNPNYRSRLGN